MPCSLGSPENRAPTIFCPVLMTEMMGILSCSHICSTTLGQEALRPRTTFSSLWQEGNYALSFEKSGIIGKSLSLCQCQVKIALGWVIHFGNLCIFITLSIGIDPCLWTVIGNSWTSWWMQLFSHLWCKFWKQKLHLNNFPWNIFWHFQESDILASSVHIINYQRQVTESLVSLCQATHESR